LAAPLDGRAIAQKVIENDMGGVAGLELEAHFTIKDRAGASSDLAFYSLGQRYEGNLTRSVLRFTAPQDVAGAAFLQIQKKDDDDERHLFLPALKKARRIAGASRSQSFMGTDLYYADLDGKDWREGDVGLVGEENCSSATCWHVLVTPKPGGPYQKFDAWVRQDNFIVTKVVVYDRDGNLLKTRVVQEIRKVQNRFFPSKALITNNKDGHSTLLTYDKIVIRASIPNDEFTLRSLEKL
jgi:hypothetical protein